MECFNCISICPFNCLYVDKDVSRQGCVRFMEKSALKMDKEKCTGCNMCIEVCPIGELALSTNDCFNCIVCKNRPECAVIPCVDRASFFNSINSLAHFMISKIGFSIRSI